MNLPDLLTVTRLLLMPVLLMLARFGAPRPYFWVLLAALLTDVLDGFLARRLHTASAAGARLDSVADRALYLSLPLGLWWLFPWLFREHGLLLSGLLAGYLATDLASWLKFRRVVSYHTRGAKVSAVLAGITALGLFWVAKEEWLFYPTAAVLCLSYVEEIAITLTLTRYETDVSSWWEARRRVRAHRERQRAAG
jgi:phosphatidylglycerophosphate synthase